MTSPSCSSCFDNAAGAAVAILASLYDLIYSISLRKNCISHYNSLIIHLIHFLLLLFNPKQFIRHVKNQRMHLHYKEKPL
jgi:hypothetical protein